MSKTKVEKAEVVEISEVIEISDLVGKICAWLDFEPVLGLTSFIELNRPVYPGTSSDDEWVLQLILDGEERDAKLFLANGDRALSRKEQALLTYLLEEACFEVHLIDAATLAALNERSQNG